MIAYIGKTNGTLKSRVKDHLRRIPKYSKPKDLGDKRREVGGRMAHAGEVGVLQTNGSWGIDMPYEKAKTLLPIRMATGSKWHEVKEKNK